jgi:hypothetical protein
VESTNNPTGGSAGYLLPVTPADTPGPAPPLRCGCFGLPPPEWALCMGAAHVRSRQRGGGRVPPAQRTAGAGSRSGVALPTRLPYLLLDSAPAAAPFADDSAESRRIRNERLQTWSPSNTTPTGRSTLRLQQSIGSPWTAVRGSGSLYMAVGSGHRRILALSTRKEKKLAGYIYVHRFLAFFFLCRPPPLKNECLE